MSKSEAAYILSFATEGIRISYVPKRETLTPEAVSKVTVSKQRLHGEMPKSVITGLEQKISRRKLFYRIPRDKNLW